jgi:hypothetical protein
MPWHLATTRHAFDGLGVNTHEFGCFFTSQRTFNAGSFAAPVQLSCETGGVVSFFSCGPVFWLA